MSSAGQRRVISRSRASAGSAEERMVATTSSTFDTATARPQRTWLRSRALRSSKAVRRATTSSRKVMKCVRKSRSVSCSGRPPFSASMLQPKLVCIGVKRHSWFSTTSGVASRLSSITTRTPIRSDSSCTWAMPSIFFSRTSLGDLLDHRALFT